MRFCDRSSEYFFFSMSFAAIYLEDESADDDDSRSSFPHPVVPASSLPQPSSASFNSPASKTSTLPPPDRQRHLRIRSRLRSWRWGIRTGS